MYNLYLKNLKTKETFREKLFFKFLDKFYQGRKVREFYYDKYNWTLMNRNNISKKFKNIHKINRINFIKDRKKKNVVFNKNKLLFIKINLYK